MKIGVDIGGTKIRAGLINAEGEVLKSVKAPCPNKEGKQAVLDFIADMIGSLLTDEVDAIGVGVPAIVDERGFVHECVNIPSWDVVDVKGSLERRFGLPVSVRNDCNCYALGVKSSEAGRKYDDLVCLTLGTGVGSGIIINGQLYLGQNSCAGEIGEIQYRDRNYEYYCSSRFFRDKGLSGREVSRAAAAGDPEALALWKEFGSNVADLLMVVMLAYSPQAIFLGGSLSEAYPYFEPSMRERLQAFPYKKVLESIEIHAMDAPDIILTGTVF